MPKKNLILILLLLSASLAFAKDNIAILPFSGGTGDEGDALAERLSYDRRLGEVFTPIPRTSITRAIDREQNFQMGSGLTQWDTYAAIGHQLGAQYVMAGNITNLGKTALLVISIMKMDTLELIAGDIQGYTNIEEILERFPLIAENVINAIQNDTGKLDKLAVVPVQFRSGADERIADTLAQILSIHLIQRGQYAVYPRTKSLEQVQDEYDNQFSGITADENIIDIGHGDNPHLVLSVGARKVGTINMFNASIIDLVNGSQLVGRSVDYSGIDDGMNAMEKLAQDLTSSAEDVSLRQKQEAEQRAELQAAEAKLREQQAKQEAKAQAKYQAKLKREDAFLDFSIFMEHFIPTGINIGVGAGIAYPFYSISDELNGYNIDDNLSEMSLNLSAMLGLRFGKVFSLQAEVMTHSDSVRMYKGEPSLDIETNSGPRGLFSLMIPVLARFDIDLGDNFFFAPIAGVYFNIRLEKNETDIFSNEVNFNRNDFKYNVPTLGWTAGIRLSWIGMFLDIRYMSDIGKTSINDDIGIMDIYQRSMFSFSVGLDLKFGDEHFIF